MRGEQATVAGARSLPQAQPPVCAPLAAVTLRAHPSQHCARAERVDVGVAAPGEKRTRTSPASSPDASASHAADGEVWRAYTLTEAVRCHPLHFRARPHRPGHHRPNRPVAVPRSRARPGQTIRRHPQGTLAAARLESTMRRPGHRCREAYSRAWGTGSLLPPGGLSRGRLGWRASQPVSAGARFLTIGGAAWVAVRSA